MKKTSHTKYTAILEKTAAAAAQIKQGASAPFGKVFIERPKATGPVFKVGSLVTPMPFFNEDTQGYTIKKTGVHLFVTPTAGLFYLGCEGYTHPVGSLVETTSHEGISKYVLDAVAKIVKNATKYDLSTNDFYFNERGSQGVGYLCFEVHSDAVKAAMLSSMKSLPLYHKQFLSVYEKYQKLQVEITETLSVLVTSDLTAAKIKPTQTPVDAVKSMKVRGWREVGLATVEKDFLIFTASIEFTKVVKKSLQHTINILPLDDDYDEDEE